MKIFEWLKTNQQLRDELKKKTEEAFGYKNTCFQLLDKSTAEIVIEKTLNRGLNWYKYQNLPKEEWRAYYNETQEILKGKVLNNEINQYILDLVQEIAMRSKDFDNVLRLRSMINVLTVLRERLGKIVSPDKEEPTKENLNSTL